jgi:predicted transposase YbfD/YdcC
MECTVGTLVLAVENDAERQALLSDVALTSLQGLFTAVPDPRSRHGQRYPLAFLLTCLVAALLCNCNSLAATGQWCRLRQEVLARVFGPRRHLTPTGALYRWLLPRLAAEHVEAVLAAWVQATLHAPADEPLVADGKTVRGARTAETPAPHLLSISTAHSQETLLQVRVAIKTNEIPVLQAVLPALPVAGRVVLADALHTQVVTAAAIRAQKGDYVLIVKDNQPALHDAIALYFADPTSTSKTDATTDKGHGRREHRLLKVTTTMTRYLADGWPGLAQVGQLIRTVTEHATTRQETVYVITSLPRSVAGPRRLLALIRAYWCIENSRHYVRDVTFGEDASRLRTGTGPQIMAALRNLAITLIHRQGTSSIAETRRFCAANPDLALALLVSPPSLPR